MKKIKQVIKSANRLAENPGGGNPTRKEFANELVAKFADKFGAPKTAVNEYAVILLNELFIQYNLHPEIRIGKDKMRLGFIKPKTSKEKTQ